MKGREIHSLNDGTGIVGSESSSGKRKWVPKRKVYCEMMRKRKRGPQDAFNEQRNRYSR